MADAIRSLPALQLKQLSRFGSSADEVITRLAQEEDAKSLTPLHLACIKGRAAAAGVLMSFGVNPFAMVRSWAGLGWDRVGGCCSCGFCTLMGFEVNPFAMVRAGLLGGLAGLYVFPAVVYGDSGWGSDGVGLCGCCSCCWWLFSGGAVAATAQ